MRRSEEVGTLHPEPIQRPWLEMTGWYCSGNSQQLTKQMEILDTSLASGISNGAIALVYRLKKPELHMTLRVTEPFRVAWTLRRAITTLTQQIAMMVALLRRDAMSAAETRRTGRAPWWTTMPITMAFATWTKLPVARIARPAITMLPLRMRRLACMRPDAMYVRGTLPTAPEQY